MYTSSKLLVRALWKLPPPALFQHQMWGLCLIISVTFPNTNLTRWWVSCVEVKDEPRIPLLSLSLFSLVATTEWDYECLPRSEMDVYSKQFKNVKNLYNCLTVHVFWLMSDVFLGMSPSSQISKVNLVSTVFWLQPWMKAKTKTIKPKL